MLVITGGGGGRVVVVVVLEAEVWNEGISRGFWGRSGVCHILVRIRRTQDSVSTPGPKTSPFSSMCTNGTESI